MTTDQLRAAAEQIVEHHKSAVAVDSYCEGALKLAKAWLAEHPADAPGGAELPKPTPPSNRKEPPQMASEWKYLSRNFCVRDFVASDGYLYRVELQARIVEGRYVFWTRLSGVTDNIHFDADSIEAGQAEALRLVREAVKRLSEAVG